MFTRPLFPSGPDVCAIGLGCWAIGGPFWDAGGWMGYGEVDEAESLRALEVALDAGANLFDTADVYGCGHSERLLGQALSGRRDQVIIAGKFGYTFDEAKREVLGRDPSPEGVRRSCEATLRRLQSDYIDLYQLHLFDLPIEQALGVRDTLDALVAEGKVRWYAWCCEDLPRVRAFAHEAKHCIAVPQLINVLEYKAEVLALCDELTLTPLARRPLGMGLLTGKFNPASTLADNDMRKRFGWDFRNGKQAHQLKQLEAVRAALTSDGRTLAQGALGWLWAKDPHAIPFPGFKTVKQIEEHLGALRYGPLSAEAMQAVEVALGRHSPTV